MMASAHSRTTISNLFLISNLAGPFGDVLITLFQSYPHLYRKLLQQDLRRIRSKTLTDLIVRPSAAADLLTHIAAAMAALQVLAGGGSNAWLG
jgi:hypothetical protein